MVYNRDNTFYIFFVGGKLKESDFQSNLIKKLKVMLPGCVILKNDPSHAQGVPDLTVLYQDKWAMLEVKASHKSKEQPNQRFYVDEMNRKSFAAFIYPENEEEILHELQLAFDVIR